MAISEFRDELVSSTRTFVEKSVMPVVMDMERRDEFPEEIIRQMAEMGHFGMLIPQQYGGLELDLGTYWRVIAELSRGWMSLGGAINSHAITGHLINKFGSDELREAHLPAMAAGEKRAALAMTEAGAGSDIAAITTRAVRSGDEYIVNGSKMFITNGQRAGLVLLMAVTDPDAQPAYRGISMLLAERGPGLEAGQPIHKLGYKGIETVELSFTDLRVPVSGLLGDEEGQGFYHAMDGSEVGRINVAARAIGVARAALEEAMAYASERETFGKPISKHQGIQFMLADMATQLTAATTLLDHACTLKQTGARVDGEIGMAKLYATEMALKVTTDSMRIHGGYGYTNEFAVERLYREAPQMVVAEGTNEIQKLVVSRALMNGTCAYGVG